MITAPDLLLNRSKQMGVVEKNPEEREKREESEPGDRRHTTRCLAALAILGLSVLSDECYVPCYFRRSGSVYFTLYLKICCVGGLFSRVRPRPPREARRLFRRQVEEAGAVDVNWW